MQIVQCEQEINWDGVMIYRRYKTDENKAKDTDICYDSDLTNGFFADDLNMVEQAISSGEFGKNPMEQAILDYITGVYAEENQELQWIDFQNRIDVYNDWKNGHERGCADFFHCNLDIAKAPLGKWPSKFMPCLMQQLAVNLCWSPSLKNLPIFSVNGPPGTGKTTLLKEIIAGNVVERACILAEYSDPDAAFYQKHFQDGDKRNRGYSDYYSGYYAFADDRIKDYGMLVASCNNAAVENITKELPDGGALLKGIVSEGSESDVISQGLKEVQKLFTIDGEETEEYRVWNNGKEELRSYPDIYFTKLANDLAGREDLNWDRWGLISAPFGKMSNLKGYIYSVLKTYIKSFGSNDSIEKHKNKYKDAVERFQEQFARVKRMEQELQQISSAWNKFSEQKALLYDQAQKLILLQKQKEQENTLLLKKMQELEQRLKLEKQTLKKYQGELESLKLLKARQDGVQKDVDSKMKGIRQQIMELEGRRRFLDMILEIFRRPTMLSRNIQEQYQVLSEVEQTLQEETEKAEQLQQKLEQQNHRREMQDDVIRMLQKQYNTASQAHQNCVKQIAQLSIKIEENSKKEEEAYRFYRVLLSEAATQQADQTMNVLDEEFFRLYASEEDDESTKAQITNPWQTAAYNREREKLFYEALKLHKAFLLGSKYCLRNFKNLLLLWGEPREDDRRLVSFSKRDRENAFGSLLNTVFLLTPVLSTTFASAGNMLSFIRQPGEIGCLIIDEAGQASPQMALGSLFRCRRAIVVGDPKQIEPVVTDEMNIIKQVIQNEYTGFYQSKTHSVQEFADRLNTIGTIYNDGEKKTWVGCPLVVHRRCISPMFELSNALSYNNMMKQQTALPGFDKEICFCRDSSGWINVSGSEKSTVGKDHYVDAQGKKAWELIKKAFKSTIDILPSLFVITPFTTVRNGMQDMIRSQPEYKQDKRFADWVEQCIGTVHTFQGKEADQVIFLLGCDKNSLSAVKWVNTNIVNVAVTRAKYRLYIIGDYTVWQHSSLFQKVKGILDSYAFRMLQKTMNDPNMSQNKGQIERLLKETPGADSLTMEGELDDSLVTPLFQELDGLWKNSSLTAEQKLAFGLTESDIKCLPPMIQQRLTSSILLHELFAVMRERYSLEGMDASCAGILFCKTMESMLKEMLLGKLKELFPDEKINRGKLCDLDEKRATTGTFTYILNKEELRSRLVLRRISLFEEICDEQWWKTYAEELEKFREVRNICCHSQSLSWQKEKELIQILFEHREFMKTLVGKAL